MSIGGKSQSNSAQEHDYEEEKWNDKMEKGSSPFLGSAKEKDGNQAEQGGRTDPRSRKFRTPKERKGEGGVSDFFHGDEDHPAGVIKDHGKRRKHQEI